MACLGRRLAASPAPLRLERGFCGGRRGLGATPGVVHAHAKHYDAVVVGLGAFGSSTLYHLAKAGLKVLGIERHSPIGHGLGSSHGASRIIRLAYFEGLQYGPLLKRSLQLFHDLQAEAVARGWASEEPLFLRTGMLDVGAVFERSLQSARVHNLQHEVLTGAELNKRFPGYRVPEHWQALLQPDGGVLAPERIVQTHVRLAQELGADVAVDEAVTCWQVEGDGSPGAGVSLRLAAGGGGGGGGSERHVSAGAVVMAPGPWISQLVPELADLCVPERQVVGWFEIEPSSRQHFAPERFPVFVIEESPGGAAYYGFPEHGDLPGFKIGLYRHLREELRTPAAVDGVRRDAGAADEAALRAGAAAYFPGAGSGRLLHSSACYFTNTPDGHFLVDRHPRHPQVILCSACSGHGFKMSSGIGQLMARMVLDGPSPAGSSSSSSSSSSSNSSGADGGGWAELLPFRFDPEGRPGHKEALARFLR
ncbi:hypothetical protein HYH02_002949 [Chlamydomonas schloesseri]|uniref:FAD dependent oxidoreductase domain-containing protein n=1 Tax=Chlamydomonas schloesseri TaxID=2026947 RepID=A0A835WSN1_9CHLO|nr:hypothetical protein HYH02_002949 [Chlamydomonas schloesseri]|eukprot:KAG2452717.1 hypothetical protein HYH02_002949 [Chlamydomonas schloesseri]